MPTSSIWDSNASMAVFFRYNVQNKHKSVIFSFWAIALKQSYKNICSQKNNAYCSILLVFKLTLGVPRSNIRCSLNFNQTYLRNGSTDFQNSIFHSLVRWKKNVPMGVQILPRTYKPIQLFCTLKRHENRVKFYCKWYNLR